MKKLLLITAAFLIFASVALYSSQKAFSGPEEHSSASSATGNVKDLALELESRQAALQEREKELTENEQHLKEREKALDEKIKQLTALRESITGEIEGQKKQSEERVLKMVTVFETMSPKSASGVIETLDDTVAVEVLKRMEIKKMAKIMNIMDKNRSAKLSEMLTGHYSNSRNDLTKNPAGQSSGRDVASKEAPKPAAPAQPKAATPSATEPGNSGAAGAENSTKGK